MTDCSLMIIMDISYQFSLIWSGNRQNLSFYEANDMCKCLYGDDKTLSSIHSLDENNIVREMMLNSMSLDIDTIYGKDDVLIGLNRLEDSNKWSWIDGSKIDYTKWEYKLKIEPDAEDYECWIDRQEGNYEWWGRGRLVGDGKNTRWFLCNNGEDAIGLDEEEEEEVDTFLEIIIPSVSGGIVLLLGFCIWILKRFFNIVVFKCCHIRLENNMREADIELIGEVIGDAEIIIDN